MEFGRSRSYYKEIKAFEKSKYMHSNTDKIHIKL